MNDTLVELLPLLRTCHLALMAFRPGPDLGQRDALIAASTALIGAVTPDAKKALRSGPTRKSWDYFVQQVGDTIEHPTRERVSHLNRAIVAVQLGIRQMTGVETPKWTPPVRTRYLKIKEVAAEVDFSVSTVRRWTKQKNNPLPICIVNRKHLIKESVLHDWFDNHQ